DCKYKTQLYDFNQRVLDINAYENFAQYVERFGLNTNSTVLYLCTNESLAHKNEPPTKTKDTIVTFGQQLINYKKKLRRSHEFIQLMQKHDILLYTNNVKNACDKCQSIQELLTSNKNKFNRIHIFSTIMNLFPGILRNLEILRDIWLQSVEHNKNKFSRSSITKNSIERAQALSPPLQQTKENSDLFKNISTCLNDLVDLLNSRGSTIFRQSILSAIVEIKCMQLNVNLHDEQSLNDVKRKIVSVENKISQILDEQSVNNFNIELNQQIDGSCRKALRTIEFLLVILNRYQMQAQQTNRNKYSRWSSPPRLFNET
ncbi:unnamed protein product, partial [Rotaria magnacalcarata]